MKKNYAFLTGLEKIPPIKIVPIANSAEENGLFNAEGFDGDVIVVHDPKRSVANGGMVYIITTTAGRIIGNKVEVKKWLKECLDILEVIDDVGNRKFNKSKAVGTREPRGEQRKRGNVGA